MQIKSACGAELIAFMQRCSAYSEKYAKQTWAFEFFQKTETTTSQVIKKLLCSIPGYSFPSTKYHTPTVLTFLTFSNWWPEKIRRAHKNNNKLSFSLVCGKLQDKQLLKAPRVVNLWEVFGGEGSRYIVLVGIQKYAYWLAHRRFPALFPMAINANSRAPPKN